MKLYRTETGFYVEQDGYYYSGNGLSWDALVAHEDLCGYLSALIDAEAPSLEFHAAKLLAPIGQQEVWAAGVTYERQDGAGQNDLYERVSRAERPFLFFKSTASRTVGPGGKVRLRADARRSIPEPELTLLLSPKGKIVGYTVGNDLSSCDLEAENPLYLSQAKVYDGSCALGPCILINSSPLPQSTEMEIEIVRHDRIVFSGSVALTKLRRDPKTLTEYLFRDNSFPNGCFLMTGAGIVPPSAFTLASGDLIRITIEPIGTLENEVA